MIKMKLYYLLTIIIGIIPLSQINAQNYSNDMMEMNKFFGENSLLEMNIQVQAFLSNNPESAIYEQKGVLRKKEHDFYFQLDKTEVLIAENRIVLVDNESKEIVYRKLDKDEYTLLTKKYYLENLDSIISQYDSLVFKGIENKKKYYQIYTSNKLVDKVELILDEQTNCLVKIIYFYNQRIFKNKIFKSELSFENITTTPVFSEKTFSSSKYMTTNGKSKKPSPLYSSYKLNEVNYE